MTDKTTPAFPGVTYITLNGEKNPEGMTLRDYFAAKAMQGFAAYIGPSMTFESRAKIAYEWADAMLKARQE